LNLNEKSSVIGVNENSSNDFYKDAICLSQSIKPVEPPTHFISANSSQTSEQLKQMLGS
jgi:hypothetical protein